MATWEDVKQALVAKGMQFDDYGQSISIGFSLENGRTQMVGIEHRIIADSIDTVAFLTPIGKYDSRKAEELLKEAAGLPFGIAVQSAEGHDFFILQAGTPLDDFDGSELDFYLSGIAMVADSLEAAIFHTDTF